MNPLVTIMIATYNQAKYIRQAVESCLNQDYENLEVVVGDDSTNNENYQVIEPLLTNPKLKYFRNEMNLGRVNNYKKLLRERATGDWVVMLDGDDYYLDMSFISKAVQFIKRDEKIVLVAAGHLTCDEQQNVSTSVSIAKDDTVFDGKEIFYKHHKLGQHSTNVYKRELAIELDFYRLDSMGADSESLFRMCLHGKVAYLSAIVVYWRLHNSNNTFKADESLKQMREMVFIDDVYKYSLNFIDKKTAMTWRKYMFTAMSYHILHLAEKSENFMTVLRSAIWALEFRGWTVTFRYLKHYIYKKYIFKLSN